MSRFPLSDLPKLTFDYVLSCVEVKSELGDGSVMALCPAHSDTHKPSLHVTEAADGHAVMHCFVGCTYGQLVEALLGMTAQPEPVKIAPKQVQSNGQATGLTSLAWLAKYTNLDPEFLKTQDLNFDHKDEVGYFWKGIHSVKWRQIGSKKFRWTQNGNEAPPLWPTLPDSLDKTIFLAAGETDCLCLRATGVDAFALTKGEGTQLSPQLFAQLKQRKVKEIVFAPDVDKAGQKGAQILQEAVERAGLDFTLLDLAPHLNLTLGEKDVRGLTIRVGVEVLRDLLEKDYLQGPPLLSEGFYASLQGVSTVIPWICKPILAKGGTTLFSAPAKSGKTTMLLKILNAMGNGGQVLSYPVNKGRVLLWTENSRMVLLQKTATHLQPPADHVYVVYRDEERLLGKSFEEALHLVLRDAQRRFCDLVVIDTLTGLGMVEDENDAAKVYALLVPINRLAHKYQIGIAMIHHLGKSGTERGSTVLLSEADIIVRLEGEYKDPRTLKIKNNMLLNQPEERKFTMDEFGNYEILGLDDQYADTLSLFSSKLQSLRQAWEGAGRVWSDQVRQDLTRDVEILIQQDRLKEVKQGAPRPTLYQKGLQVVVNAV